MMSCDELRCVMMSYDELRWVTMSYDVLWWVMMCYDELWCVMMSYDELWWGMYFTDLHRPHASEICNPRFLIFCQAISIASTHASHPPMGHQYIKCIWPASISFNFSRLELPRYANAEHQHLRDEGESQNIGLQHRFGLTPQDKKH